MRLLLGVGLALLFYVPRAFSNVVGSDTQNFNPTTNGLDFVTVHSSETLEPGIVNVGFFLNYAVNTLPYFDDQTSQSRVDINDSLMFADFNIGIGLTDNWDAGISFPSVLSQTVRSDTFRGEFARPGLTEIRVNTKYRFWGDNSRGFALVASMNNNQIENNPFSGQGSGPTYNLEAAVDQTWGLWAVGLNAGYRWRQPGTAIVNVPVAPFRNQYIYSAAGSYLFESIDTKLIVELFGSYPAEEVRFQSNRNQSSLELLAGLKHDLTRDIALHGGMGTEVANGSASPDWRVYAGVNWTFGPLWSRGQPGGPAETPVIVRSDNLNIPFDAKPEKFESFRASELLFEFDSDKIRPESQEALARLANHLMKPPEFKKLVVEGHTDSMGPAPDNLDLSNRRAASVKKFLVENHKLDGKRIQAVGHGETKPIADNGNWQGRRKNRRVEFQVER
ncbi:MAG: OmpA family protein [Bdellovibrionia bacterium]